MKRTFPQMSRPQESAASGKKAPFCRVRRAVQPRKPARKRAEGVDEAAEQHQADNQQRENGSPFVQEDVRTQMKNQESRRESQPWQRISNHVPRQPAPHGRGSHLVREIPRRSFPVDKDENALTRLQHFPALAPPRLQKGGGFAHQSRACESGAARPRPDSARVHCHARA